MSSVEAHASEHRELEAPRWRDRKRYAWLLLA